MRDPEGKLTPEAVDFLNRAARENPLSLYPLPQTAADLGRAGLLLVASRMNYTSGNADSQWLLTITEAGWEFVTCPTAIHERRKRIAFKKLGGQVVG